MEKIFNFIIKYKAVLIGAVAVLLVAMLLSLALLVYNSTLRINSDEIVGVYGMNGSAGLKIPFDDQTVDAVLNAVTGMKYQGNDESEALGKNTYVCIEMSNGDKYIIKYCGSSAVYVSQGAARKGNYANHDNPDGMENIIAILYSLENKYGSATVAE